MDLGTAPAITEAVVQRAQHPIYGYTQVPNSYYESIINWFERRHQWTIRPEWIQYTTGVVPALSAVIKAMTQPGDKVIVQTPVYNCFYSSIRNNQCEALLNPLLPVPTSEPGIFTYAIDFDDLERKAADPRAKLLILCNPHNPAGRVWKPQELSQLNSICMQNGITVVADEIHCELVMPGYHFIPFASVSDECQQNSITCNSPSKSFNTAGLQIANIICSNPATRHIINRAININEICDVNPFGVVALQAAYNQSEQWIDELCNYLSSNYKALCKFVSQRLPQLPVCQLEGTYLVWIDISSLGISSKELADRLLNEAKVMINDGTMYDPTSQGRHYIRLNIACPRTQMMEALERIANLALVI